MPQVFPAKLLFGRARAKPAAACVSVYAEDQPFASRFNPLRAVHNGSVLLENKTVKDWKDVAPGPAPARSQCAAEKLLFQDLTCR